MYRTLITLSNTRTMNCGRSLFTVLLCLGVLAGNAQDGAAHKRGKVSFAVNLSDYNFVKFARDSSLNYALHQKTLLGSGRANFGLAVVYWSPIISHVDFSGDLGGTFSNFPAFFVKGDSIGQASFSVYGDGLIHLKAFEHDPLVNPFITAGLGAGYFGKQAVLYAPLGVGLAFHFKQGGSVVLQMQMRKALTQGITNDFIFYSLGFAQAMTGSSHKKQEGRRKTLRIQNPLSATGPGNNEQKRTGAAQGLLREIENGNVISPPGAGTAELEMAIRKSKIAPISKEVTVTPMDDSDGDGIPDPYDKCPGQKGIAKYQGCPFPMLEDAVYTRMTPDSVTYRIYFDFDRSDLYSEAFAVLGQVMEMLRSDTTLTVSIAGYADSKGSIKKNMDVSADRAKVTRDYFLSYSIAPSRIKWAYFGSSNPVDNVVQWKNRRVEITIIKKRNLKESSPWKGIE